MTETSLHQAPNARWARLRRMLEGERLPTAFVDLNALEHNQRVLLDAMAPGVTLRLANKSLRVPALARRLLDADARIAGLMTFSAAETLRMADAGFGDLLCGYPVARPEDAEVFAVLAERGVRAVAMVDHPAHLQVLQAAAIRHRVAIPACIDVDASWRPLGAGNSAVHIGVRRSPIRSAQDAVSLAEHAARLRREHAEDGADPAHGVFISAVMAYEAQVAGLPDRVPGEAALAPVRQLIKRKSRPMVARRRREVVEALRAAGCEITLVNGGGTGSIRATSADGSCTEVTAGSGFFCPHTFDGYDDLPLRPAAFFALPVVRASDPGMVTCGYGGFVASGPAGTSRWPVTYLPEGLAPTGLEGWGEVQTPLTTAPHTPPLIPGDPVICRHAKAGELMEHFAEVLLVRDDAIVDRVATLRGMTTA